MTEDLKPCPFCGGKAEIRHVTSLRDAYGKYNSCFVICPSCLTTSDNYPSRIIATQRWNRRQES